MNANLLDQSLCVRRVEATEKMSKGNDKPALLTTDTVLLQFSPTVRHQLFCFCNWSEIRKEFGSVDDENNIGVIGLIIWLVILTRLTMIPKPSLRNTVKPDQNHSPCGSAGSTPRIS